MRFDASPPVCYVLLYRLCSLVSSPVFTHIFAFLSVLLCPPLSSRSRPFSSLSPAIYSCLSVPPSVPVSQSRHLSPSLSPAICPPSPCLFPAILLSTQLQHPIPSAHNPHIRSHWAVHSDEIWQLTTHLDEIGAEFVHFDHPITDFVRMNRTAAQRIRTAAQRIRASDRQRDLFSGKANV